MEPVCFVAKRRRRTLLVDAGAVARSAHETSITGATHRWFAHRKVETTDGTSNLLQRPSIPAPPAPISRAFPGRA
jgi:hypothetical protein